jgi:hypothetical protein
MSYVDPARPFSTAWTSMSLYREDSAAVDDFLGEWADAADELGGTAVMIDFWDDALDDAWEQLATSTPAVADWVADYRSAMDAADDAGLSVAFGDTTRIVGRKGYGGYGVSYPASLLLAGGDPVAAMRTAIITVLDKHVTSGGLDVPPFSSVISGS